MSASDDRYFSHWADIAAKRTIKAHPDAARYTCAAGITPSGTVHIGNFREIITVDLVVRAIADQGKDVRFIYSWDDFDVFRKVPKGMPQPEMLEENLRRSIADIPDPFGEHESYAAHNIAEVEESIVKVGIEPEFIRQSKRYRAGAYAEGIRKALESAPAIKKVLDEFRREPLPDDWLPIAGFCEECGRDELDLSWDGDWGVHVKCRSCGHESDVDLRKGGSIKLLWRIDWPMRWNEEKVCFEPGGKDHSSDGGSYDTGKTIVSEIYGWAAPEYVAYDFVRIKGRGGKISSSAGNVVTLATCLDIYEPEMLRWIFAGTRPNKEFAISFDADFIKLYEDYDRERALAHEAEDGGKRDKKRQQARRTMELSSVKPRRITPGTPLPYVPAVRPLSLVVQVFDGDIDRTVAYFEARGDISTDDERELCRVRAQCVWNWIDKEYAPEEFRYRIRTEPHARELSADEQTAVRRIVDALESNPDMPEPELITVIKGLTADTELSPKELFPTIYDLLIARPKGPKLSTLLSAMGGQRVVPLLKASLGG